jgi:hypothetical protein
MATYYAQTISVSIERDWREVYDFAAKPENIPRWAAGLAAGLERSGEAWVAQGPLGPIRIRFSPRNDFGVLDHVVVMADGAEIENPMRVVANGTGAEVMFTVLRRPGMDEGQFADDAAAVKRDLEALRALLER